MIQSLVIRAWVFWREGQNTFFDVRVTNIHDVESQKDATISSILNKNEQEKKLCYNMREAQRKEGREVRGHNGVLGGKVIIPRNEIDSAVEEDDTKH